MINLYEVAETNEMISKENLDVRTITLGISLLDCIDADLQKLNEKVYQKITTVAKDLVKTGEGIEKEYGIPIVNKRISVTPMAHRRCSLQERGRFCDSGADDGPGSQGSWRKPDRRIFRTGVKGNDKGR